MAGIDKTYVKSWADYVKVRDWVLSVGEVKDDFGNIFSPYDWMAEYEEAEFKEAIEEQKKRYRDYYADPEHVKQAKDFLGEDWEPDKEGIGELVLWNTPTYFDVWLIRECPIQFIQDRLRQQYASDYDKIKERKSEYDLYTRPAASQHFKLFPAYPSSRVKNGWLHIQVEDNDWNYSEETKEWHHWLECREFNTNTMDIKGPLTRRKLKRVIKKCGFPAGIKLTIFYGGQIFEVVIKK